MGYEHELLHVKPSAQGCLAWSVDGELAIAAGEYVVILGTWTCAEGCLCISLHFPNLRQLLTISIT